jgi:hypothetical protein
MSVENPVLRLKIYRLALRGSDRPTPEQWDADYRRPIYINPTLDTLFIRWFGYSLFLEELTGAFHEDLLRILNNLAPDTKCMKDALVFKSGAPLDPLKFFHSLGHVSTQLGTVG